VITFIELSSVTGTKKTDDGSAGSDDDSVDSSLSRPHYYDSLDDSEEKPSLPSVASGFIKTQPSSSNAAEYNSVAKKLMVCLIILARFLKFF